MSNSIPVRPTLCMIVFGLAIPMASPVSAQVCRGGAPFSNRPVRIGATFGGSSGADHVVREGGAGLGARLALGSAQGLFGSVGGSIVLYSGATRFSREELAERTGDDAGAVVVSAVGGYTVPVASSGNVVLCPVLGFSRQMGPRLVDECSPSEGGGMTCSGGMDGRGSTFWSGGTVGRSFRSSPRLSLVPFAGIAYVRSTLTARGWRGSASATLGYVAITAGAGFVWSRMTVRPVVSVPVGLEGGHPTQGLEISFGLGSKGTE